MILHDYLRGFVVRPQLDKEVLHGRQVGRDIGIPAESMRRADPKRRVAVADPFICIDIGGDVQSFEWMKAADQFQAGVDGAAQILESSDSYNI